MKIKLIGTCYLLFLCSLPFAYSQSQAMTTEDLHQTSKTFATIARSVSPSVVFIRVEHSVAQEKIPKFFSPFGDDFFEQFFGQNFPRFELPQQPRQRRGFSQGSGFVLANKGGLFVDRSYVVTNSHVVKDADKITVTLNDGREFNATIVGTDPQSDIAVLSINSTKLTPVVIGDSSKLEVGEWVVAIGNPFGLSHSLTVGVVSAKGRTSLGITDYEDFIQTDAAINPGNSGGPLVNLKGEVVAMNTAIFTQSGGYMGIGFAIPIDLVKNITNQLVDEGEVTRGFLGIFIQNLNKELAESFELDVHQGVLISEIQQDSPADKAGLREGDVIVDYQGKPVSNVGGFRNMIALSPPGSKQKLAIIRDGKRKNITVKIGKLERQEQIDIVEDKSSEVLGITVQTVTRPLADQFGIKAGEGVLVTHVKSNSIASLAGISVNTVILQVDRVAINSVTDFQREINKSSKNRRVLLLVQKGKRRQYVVLNW